MISVVQEAATTRVVGAAAAIGIAGIAIFQLGLALGAPLGRAAWGGRIAGRLPAGLRIASLAAVFVWSFSALVVLGRAGVGPLPSIHWLTWLLCGLLLIGSVMNVASSSRWERYFWGPYAFLLASLTFVVARS